MRDSKIISLQVIEYMYEIKSNKLYDIINLYNGFIVANKYIVHVKNMDLILKYFKDLFFILKLKDIEANFNNKWKNEYGFISYSPQTYYFFIQGWNSILQCI